MTLFAMADHMYILVYREAKANNKWYTVYTIMYVITPLFISLCSLYSIHFKNNINK